MPYTFLSRSIAICLFLSLAASLAATAHAGDCTDDDGDGYCAEIDDCNDSDFFINPGASEFDACFDGQDNDCDFQVDAEDPDCDDYDSDSYTIADGDCDDQNSDINPGAVELCDNFTDDDCDLATDLADDDCVDIDNDGYSTDDGDCDDDDDSVYPGAAEVENDIDDNCNGHVDEVYGAQISANGGTVTARVKGGFTGLFLNELWLFSPGEPVKIGESSDYPTAGIDGPPVVLGPFDAGTELIFGTITHNSFEDALDRFYTGPACRNFDGVFHDMVIDDGNGAITIGFEDLRGDTGGFMDNAGVVLDATQVSVFGPSTAVPERCNGIDDDCQAGVDDAPIDAGQSCSSGACEGLTTCENGALVCTGDDTDTDMDGTPDCSDECPDDIDKTAPGICGCGTADSDGDGDTVPDCNDGCPSDPGKTDEGVCGCGLGDDNTDGDSQPDCLDECPSDPAKLEPGQCGCGIADTDSDADGFADCRDSGQDIAVRAIKAGGAVALPAGGPATARVLVQIQNRSPFSLTVSSAAQLDALVDLEAESVGACPDPAVSLLPPKKVPLVIKPKKKKKVFFEITVGCANDPADGEGHGDYTLSASVDLSALGMTDTHPADDICPRTVSPPFVIDPNPDGKIKDKGCGGKLADKTFGGPVFLDVVVK